MGTETISPVQPVDVVVLAGSVNRIALFPGNEPGKKALVQMRGKPLLAYVLDALHQARHVDRITVVAAPEVLREAERSQAELFGPLWPTLRLLDADTAAGLVTDRRRLSLWVGLIRLEADAARLVGEDARADGLVRRAAELERAGGEDAERPSPTSDGGGAG